MSLSFEQALTLLNQLLKDKASPQAPSQKDELLALQGAKELREASANAGISPEYIVAAHIAALSKLKELDNPQQIPQPFLDLLDINASNQLTGRGFEEEDNPFNSFLNPS